MGALLLALALPAAAQSTVATIVEETPLRAGPGADFGVLTTLEQGLRVDVNEAQSGDAFVRLNQRYYVRSSDVDRPRGTTTVQGAALVYDSQGRRVGQLAAGAKVEVSFRRGHLVGLRGWAPASAVHAPAKRIDALPGRWHTTGKLTPGGDFTGTVTVTQSGADYAFTAELELADGKKVSWSATAKADSDRRLSLEVNLDAPGLAGALSGQTKLEGSGSYDVRRYVRGTWRSKDGSVSLRDRWTRWSPANDAGQPGDGGSATPDDGGTTAPAVAWATKGEIKAPARALAVPGTPAAGHQKVEVTVEGGKAQLVVSGAGRLLRGSEALTSPVELEAGTHELILEGSADGELNLKLRADSDSLASAKTTVAVERLYLLLFGYQGTEEHYLVGDVGKTRNNIAPHLRGYRVVEDGTSYDQAKIDRQINDPAEHRKVIVDWATNRDDLFRYLKRGTVRGIVWGSHGFMEPFPGCPDEELDLLESRVWSSQGSDPRFTGHRNFVREWKAAIEASIKTHGKLDFILMHSCCTGAIGSYADEVWHYTKAETKARAIQVLGDPLPEHDKLRYNSFDALKSQAGYLKTYVGPSYYGFSDVSWWSIRRSLNPTR
ncbi:MAG TPA: hypothetical protein DEA08_21225 [Planctomycetes bacterium]|nr:hypothetical protein [Planctomycetota bacterium]